MKIKYLKLVNFQAHEKRLVKFSPGITTIVGPSDRGKSAIIRALQWVCLNAIAGAEFVREGSKQAEATIKTIEKKEIDLISRMRSASGNVNTYEMGGDEYKAFGQGVPEDIAEVLRLSEINFQSQHDSPFWFSESPAEVSRRLNAVVDLRVIDAALAAVGTEVRRAIDHVRTSKERLVEIEDALAIIEPKRKRIDDFKKLETLKAKNDEKQQTADRLAFLIFAIRRNQAKPLEERANEATALAHCMRTALDLQIEVDYLRADIERIEELTAQSEDPPDFQPVEDARTAWKLAEAELVELQEHIELIEEREATSKQAATDAMKAERRFHKELKGKNCPLCGTPIITS